MLTRADITRLLGSGLQTVFQKAYDGVPSIYQLITTKVPSTKASEDYGWLGDSPELIEWKGERTPKALREYGFTLRNKKYEASIRVDQDAIDDDQYGQIVMRVTGMGGGAKRSFDRQLASVIEAGTSTVCYDGQNFFDTDHQEGNSPTQVNSYTSKPLNAANAKLIISAMESFVTDENQIAGITVTHIMVPTALEWTAKELFSPVVVAVSIDPTLASLKGRVEIIVNKYLTNNGANSAYYFLDLSTSVHPFIFQERKPLKFDQVTTTDPDTNAFMTDSNLYGVKCRHAFGYGDWRKASRGIG